MAYLLAILVPSALLIGFFGLTVLESSRGARVLNGARTRLDRKISHVGFIFSHVDLAGFAREEFVRLLARASHAAAHLSLRAVRFVERMLTRLVRHLRMRQAANAVPRTDVREFVKTLSDFKDNLKSTRPETVEF